MWRHIYYQSLRVVVHRESTLWYKFWIHEIKFFIKHLYPTLLSCPLARKLLQALVEPLKVVLVNARTLVPRSSWTLTLETNLNILPLRQKTGTSQHVFYLLVLTHWYLLDSIDKIEVVEISDDEAGGDEEEPVPTPPHTCRSAPKGMPSSPSPIKAKFVLFHHSIIFLFFT